MEGQKSGKLVIFSAPSGSGKSSIIRHLTEELGLEAYFSVSATSRPPRGKEVDGVDYHFLTTQAFQAQIEAGNFIEYEEVYEGLYYGTLKSEVDNALADGKLVLLDIDVKGALNVKKLYGDLALILFILPPNIPTLRERLLIRGTDSMEKIEERLGKAAYELTFAQYFDKCIVNNDIPHAARICYHLIQDYIDGVKKHVLLFPGSFNPMHVGHVAIANYLIETQPEIDELWMVLTPANPLKEQSDLLPDDLRKEWAQHLLTKHPQVKLSLVEFDLPQPHYTIKTIHHLQALHPTYRFSLLIGMDSWNDLPRWHRTEELQELVTLYIYPRPQYQPSRHLPEKSKTFYLAHAPQYDVSATAIRQLLSHGANLPYLLYTQREHPLYQRLIEEVKKCP